MTGHQAVVGLVSRYYRPPEVALGCEIGCAVDMWSLACTLYEMFTSQFLFGQNSDNRSLLLEIMRARGRFPATILARATQAGDYFPNQADPSTFVVQEADENGHISINLQPVRRLEDLVLQRAAVAKQRSRAHEHANFLASYHKRRTDFVSFLERSLQTDPAARIAPANALAHDFFRMELAACATTGATTP